MYNIYIYNAGRQVHGHKLLTFSLLNILSIHFILFNNLSKLLSAMVRMERMQCWGTDKTFKQKRMKYYSCSHKNKLRKLPLFLCTCRWKLKQWTWQMSDLVAFGRNNNKRKIFCIGMISLWIIMNCSWKVYVQMYVEGQTK